MTDKDPWAALRRLTRARIGIGRAGDALPTAALLEFQLAHARARDAVHAPIDFAALERASGATTMLRLHSAAADRTIYLRRPDLGRRLSDESRGRLRDFARGIGFDLVFVLADGLSAVAVITHAMPTLHAIIGLLPDLRIAPVICVEQARVAIGDEIGEILGAKLSVVLIGERPGLSVADSLGVYITWSPTIGTRDAGRNCISNVHADGLSYTQAGGTAAWLITEASSRRLTGIQLKAAAGSAAITAVRDDHSVL
jgi:ethanolamine ammonia-lyase small subunit